LVRSGAKVRDEDSTSKANEGQAQSDEQAVHSSRILSDTVASLPFWKLVDIVAANHHRHLGRTEREQLATILLPNSVAHDYAAATAAASPAD
jgi:hypothetical protein